MILGCAIAFAHGQFSWFTCALVILNGLLLQILANVVNDYGDFLRGSDGAGRLGPPRAMQMGWLTERAMRIGIATLLLAISIFGLWLVYLVGPVVLVAGLIAILLCLWYTLGPWPLAYLGFVEIIVFVVFGPMIVLGSYFVHTQSFALDVLVISTSPGFLAAALLLTNNLRDINQDKKNHKRTMAVRCGEAFSRKAIIAFIFGAAVGPLCLVAFFSYSPLVLVSLIAFLLPLKNMRVVLKEPVSVKLNMMLAAIGKSLYLFGALCGMGLLYGAF